MGFFDFLIPGFDLTLFFPILITALVIMFIVLFGKTPIFGKFFQKWGFFIIIGAWLIWYISQLGNNLIESISNIPTSVWIGIIFIVGLGIIFFEDIQKMLKSKGK